MVGDNSSMDLSGSEHTGNDALDFLLGQRFPGSGDFDASRVYLRTLKNTIIGSNKKKQLIFSNGLVPQLVSALCAYDVPTELKTELATVLGSLAKASAGRPQPPLGDGATHALLGALVRDDDVKLTESVLRCLRTLFLVPDPPIDALLSNSEALSLLLSRLFTSDVTQECIATILHCCCLTRQHQTLLHAAGVVQALAPLLFNSANYKLMPALRCYSALCFENPEVCLSVISIDKSGVTLVERLSVLMDRTFTTEVQLCAAKCLSNICRCGLIPPTDGIITKKVMPTVVRLCQLDGLLSSPKLRIEAVNALAYLIEDSVELQRLTADNNQCLRTLGSCLQTTSDQDEEILTPDEQRLNEELEQAVLTALAALALNDDEIRRKVGSDLPLFEPILRASCGTDCSAANASESDTKQLIAVARCLHALSRSVEQLRTSFQDRPVWRTLIRMVTSDNEQLVAISSATLCNLCLDFSPCRDFQGIIDSRIVDILCGLSRRENATLRVNGVWGLMNLAYRADEVLKATILRNFGADQCLRLITDSPTDSPVVPLVLGLVRNVLSEPQISPTPPSGGVGRSGVGGNGGGSRSREASSTPSSGSSLTQRHIDCMVDNYGQSIVQAVVFVLEGDYRLAHKELALVILSNIAAGDKAKDAIMGNEDVLRKIISYMLSAHTCLQIAATYCMSNLLWKDDPGALERQQKLKGDGIMKILQQLVNANDLDLQEKSKLALQQLVGSIN